MTVGRTVYYDLTEALLSASAKRIQYYGIARVVIETAKEAARFDPNIRFVVYSFGKKAFYEVKWVTTDDGGVEFQFPAKVEQRWFRTYFGGSGAVGQLMRLLNAFVDRRNVRLWDEHAVSLRKIEIQDGVFVSAARPKIVVDMIRALKYAESKTKIAILVHDFMPLHNNMTKWHRGFDRNFLIDNQFLIVNSDLIITNSLSTLNDMNQFVEKGMLPEPKHKIAVPLVHECPEGFEVPEISLPPAPYLLTVGLNLGRKNIEVVLNALLLLVSYNKRVPNLVLAGAHRKRLKRYLDRKELQPIREYIIFVNNPNQTDLVRMYKNALALIIPSRIEGWGLPAGEALWYGTPALCSTAPVFHEVCGKLGLYFDPDDPETLARQITQLNEDDGFRNNIRERISAARANFRTWKTVASDILSALSDLKSGT